MRVVKGSIDLEWLGSDHQILLSPPAITIATNADGSNPQLSGARSRLIVKKDNITVDANIASVTGYGCSVAYNLNVISITGLSADTGKVGIDYVLAGGERGYTEIAFTVARAGSKGADAVTVLLTNESHTVPADAIGTVTAADIATAISSIKAFRGVTPLAAVATAPVAGQFSYAIKSTSGCSAARVDDATFKCTALNANTATITVTITLEGGVSIDKVMTITKAIAGATGRALTFDDLTAAQKETLKGKPGPAVTWAGTWNPNITYVASTERCEYVDYNGRSYQAKPQPGGTITKGSTVPASSALWLDIGPKQPIIAAGLVLANEATIDNLISTKVRTGVTGARTEIEGTVERKYHANGQLAKLEWIDERGAFREDRFDLQGNKIYSSGLDGLQYVKDIPESWSQGYLLLISSSQTLAASDWEKAKNVIKSDAKEHFQYEEKVDIPDTPGVSVSYFMVDLTESAASFNNQSKQYYSPGINPSTAANKPYQGWHPAQDKTSSFIPDGWYLLPQTIGDGFRVNYLDAVKYARRTQQFGLVLSYVANGETMRSDYLDITTDVKNWLNTNYG